jgi:hypothetical protein
VPESKVISLDERAKDEGKPFLEQLLQEGARQLLQAAIENEVIDYIQFHKDRRDEDGQRLVVRNGHLQLRFGIRSIWNGPQRRWQELGLLTIRCFSTSLLSAGSTST